MKKRVCLLLVLVGLSLPARADDPPMSAPARPDESKLEVEQPTRRLVSDSTPRASDFVNPKVAPGKIIWHPTWEAALAASVKSGKPVLLFQLLGKLDDEFC